MTLADFILACIDPILDEWEKFAHAMPAAREMDSHTLRDHARGMLEAIAHDLRQEQSDSQSQEKSMGRGPRQEATTQAEMHGTSRVAAGFSVNESMAEFRALRATVLRLWSDKQGVHGDEVTRFNESIDQALTESLARYSDVKDRQARLFDALLSSSPDLNYIVDTSGKLMYVNKAFAGVFGTTPTELTGESFFDLCTPFTPDIRQQVAHVLGSVSTYCGELPIVLKDGTVLTFEYLLMPVCDPKGRCEAVAGTARDVTERKAAEERVRHSANYDYLTDLPNRSLFRERLDLDIKHAARTGLPLALMFVDLDGFKGVNDRLGHAAGDVMLQQVAGRISACVRDTDTVARLGGDEFTVILTDVTLPPHVENLARKILDALSRPFRVKGVEVTISGSVGITRYPDDGGTLDELVRHADAAMYSAKHAGRNRYRFYEDLAKGT